MTTKDIPARLERAGEILRAVQGEDDRTIELSFSSEEPYQRWWGTEILGHKKGEVDLSFIGSGRAPLLVDHERSIDHQVGVIETVRLENGKGRATVRFGMAERANEILARVRDGELSNISVGYEIRKMRLESESDGVETYRVTDWKPHEISIVSVPADPTVGINRAAGEEVKPVTLETERAPKMEANVKTEPAPAIAAPVNVDEVLKNERQRITEITAAGAKFNVGDKAQDAIKSGMTVAAFNGLVLESLGSAAEERLAAANKIGLSEKEAKRFSFMNVVRAMANPTDRRAQEAAKFEFEASDAAIRLTGREARGVRVPTDVLTLPQQRAPLAYGTAAAAGRLVQTELAPQSFIDVLRNAMLVRQLGATVLSDLTGDLDLPRKSAAMTATWSATETTDAAESNMAIDLVSLRLKDLAVYSSVTRKMMQQSSLDIEALIRDDIAFALALGIDQAAIHGTGASGQPTGIVATAGIGSVAGGTNGLAPTWAHIVGLETAVAVPNADVGNLAYLTNAKVRGKLKTTEKATNTGKFIWDETNQLNGYQGAVSNQVSSTLNKGTSTGVCSAILFGNWADLLIGFWSGVDILVDPITLGLSGGVRVIAHQDCDVQLRRPTSFAAMLDALTV